MIEKFDVEFCTISLSILGRTVYCQVERLEIVGHIGWNENANAVVIGNKALNTLRLLSFEHVKY